MDDKELRKKLGHGLRVARLASKTKTVDAAKVAGKSVDSLLRYERGEHSIPSDTLVRLAEHYGTTPDGVCRLGRLL